MVIPSSFGRLIRVSVSAAIVVLIIIVSPGCSGGNGNGIGAGAGGRGDGATSRRQMDPRSTVQPVDQSGAVAMNDAQPPAAGELSPRGSSGRVGGSDDISATVDEAVRPVDEGGLRSPGAAEAPAGAGSLPRGGPPPQTAPSTRPAPGDAPDTTGGYQLIGTVLAEVHDAPIFADKVLASIDAPLAAQAPQLDESAFRQRAAELIEKEIRRYVADELEFAMAVRKLESRDREMARMATIRWRDEQISKAGGSPELARQRAAAAGHDFDELQEDRYRWVMRQLYYQKREYPKIQVTGTDMRRYYQENLQREFTAADRARFRVIMVDPRKIGGRELALAEVNRLLERIRGGKDFAELAAEDNDQESFKHPVDWFQRGSFAVKEVEDAVWALDPGQVSGVIETADAYYLARLDAKQAGGVKSFDEVQKDIEAKLQGRQFAELQAKVQQQLMADAIVRYHPRMIELAVEMAMQKYRYWRESAAAR